MDTSSFLALALACAPQVHTDTATALVRVESSFNPCASASSKIAALFDRDQRVDVLCFLAFMHIERMFWRPP